jgi:hypothetical protein
MSVWGERPAEPVPPLLTAPVLVVVQRPKVFSSRAEYDVYAPDGMSYGSVRQVPGSGSAIFGELATVSFEVAGVNGAVLLRMVKPGTIGRAHFDVTWGGGQPVGRIAQENLLFAPQFDLEAADGTVARLTGGHMMSWDWAIEGAAGEPLGSISKEFAGLAEMFSSADRFVVQLSPAIGGLLRPLAVVATICLDEVRTQEQQR